MMKRQAVRVLITLALLLGAGATHADIYKCTDGDGNLTYSQTPCPRQKTETVNRTGPDTDAQADCSYANSFAFSSARLMQAGMTSAEVFNRYGGIDSLSNGSVNIINYVYGFRSNSGVSAERIAALAQARCQSYSFGNVTCESLPLSFTRGIGGCNQPGDQSASAATAQANDFAGAPDTPGRPSGMKNSIVSGSGAPSREAEERCKKQYRDAIDAIDAEMRRGYSSEQGEQYRERLRALTQQMRRC